MSDTNKEALRAIVFFLNSIEVRKWNYFLYSVS